MDDIEKLIHLSNTYRDMEHGITPFPDPRKTHDNREASYNMSNDEKQALRECELLDDYEKLIQHRDRIAGRMQGRIQTLQHRTGIKDEDEPI